ncbi:hypothetical protein KIW84_031474 [Lathyrus oleraceus]|uniref:Uncharacterized protein n=1 Tax=Pisum sativum TaxID=3888 RepID=A0A9D4XQQ0_PEA|nr:hypothetical protein KIW84_031474 [Pisum sativum]
MDIYEGEGLLYVQKAQLDKYRQELAAPSATTNMVQGEESQGASSHSTDNAQANNKTTTDDPTQANAYLAHQDQLHIPQELESQA